MINDAICAVLDNNDFDINIQECFDEIFSGLSNPILSGVFLSLLKTKTQTLEDVLAGINSARNAIKKNNLSLNDNCLIENICLNEQSEYLDISFATDIISAACEIGTVRAIPNNCFYKSNPFETLKAFKINTDNLNFDNFEKIKFIYGYISPESPYIKYTQELYGALPYKTILNTINHFLNPYNAKNCTVALFDKACVEKYAQLCLNLGYNNSIVFSAGDFPYVSTENETNISEAWKNKIFSYTVTPELLEIKQNPTDLLKVESSLHGAEIIQAVFENKLKNSCYDAIIINSALALYITKKAKSLMDGINLAKKTINENKAFEVLMNIKNISPL